MTNPASHPVHSIVTFPDAGITTPFVTVPPFIISLTGLADVAVASTPLISASLFVQPPRQ